MNQNNVLGDEWDNPGVTEIQDVAPDPVPPFDYEDVMFPFRDYGTPPDPRIASIYLIESAPFVKIGIAKESVARARHMAVNNPHGVKLVVVYALPVCVLSLAEAYCHQKLTVWTVAFPILDDPDTRVSQIAASNAISALMAQALNAGVGSSRLVRARI